MKASLVYVTAPSWKEAERLAEEAVTGRLAACANIFDNMTSIYRWKNELCRGKEAVLLLKTAPDRLDRLMERIRQLHSDDCPCILALSIEDGSAPFLEWIEHQTR